MSSAIARRLNYFPRTCRPNQLSSRHDLKGVQTPALHIALNASKGERTYGSYQIQNINAYISRLKHLWRASRRRDIHSPQLSLLAVYDRKKLSRHARRHPHASAASRRNLKVNQSPAELGGRPLPRGRGLKL